MVHIGLEPATSRWTVRHAKHSIKLTSKLGRSYLGDNHSHLKYQLSILDNIPFEACQTRNISSTCISLKPFHVISYNSAMSYKVIIEAFYFYRPLDLKHFKNDWACSIFLLYTNDRHLLICANCTFPCYFLKKIEIKARNTCIKLKIYLKVCHFTILILWYVKIYILEHCLESKQSMVIFDGKIKRVHYVRKHMCFYFSITEISWYSFTPFVRLYVYV